MRQIFAVSLLSLLACHGSEPKAPLSPPQGAACKYSNTLRALAAIDPRIAFRAGITPTEEDRSLAAVNHRGSAEEPGIDLFAFSDREEILSRADLNCADENQKAYRSFVAIEKARLAYERTPNAAASIARAIADTWTDALWPSGSLAPHLRRMSTHVDQMSRDEQSELSDALDALEHRLIEAKRTADIAAMSELRDSLGRARGASNAVRSWQSAMAPIAERWNLTIGTADQTATRFAEAAKGLRESIDKDVLRLSEPERRKLAERARGMLMMENAHLASPARSMGEVAAPPETAAVETAAQLVRDGATRIVGKMVLHDRIAMGTIALQEFAPGSRPAFLLSGGDALDREKIEKYSRAHADGVIVAGLVAITRLGEQASLQP